MGRRGPVVLLVNRFAKAPRGARYPSSIQRDAYIFSTFSKTSIDKTKMGPRKDTAIYRQSPVKSPDIKTLK